MAAARSFYIPENSQPVNKKKQLVVEAGDEGLTADELFYSLAA